jgi:ribitol-5-phosphate 2-dehydrogenase (NADP+) / D-ribitol-5-phosphate cytidylyltransferase
MDLNPIVDEPVGLASLSGWKPTRTVAVVLAGGTGTRLNLGVPKQLLKVAGKPIIEHTVAVLDSSPDIDDIVVLMTPSHLAEVTELIATARFRKVSAVLAGGNTRLETTRLALAALGDEPCNVLFHDAVRPLLSHRIIRECVNALRRYEAVDVAIPSADTVIVVDGDIVRDIPDRATLRRGQTPQGFRLPVIREAHMLAAADPDFAATDDCGVVLRYLPDVPIAVVEGAEENLKITHPVDVHLADKLFQLAAEWTPRPRNPHEYGEHLRGRTVVIFGGGSGIGLSVGDLAAGYGADVFSFSRSTTRTHAQRPADVEAALLRAYDATGRVDHVVVTTGVLSRGPLADLSPEVMAETLESNYLAPVVVARAALPYLEQSRGHLLLYTSSSYTRGRAGYAMYSSTKAAVVNLTQALADEWSSVGIRVNCVNPERTATPMRLKSFGPEPPDTLLSADEVAHTSIDVLLSDLTGQVVDVRVPGRRPRDGVAASQVRR